MTPRVVHTLYRALKPATSLLTAKGPLKMTLSGSGIINGWRVAGVALAVLKTVKMGESINEV